MKVIQIDGARTHNLKNISLSIPRDKLVVITGLSGSGKSSLAFDTLYAEGQRRYVESLSSYARQFLSMMEKPDVDKIEGLSPAIAIEQKTASHNPRSTVGTVTEIYDYLRVLFARIGIAHCPEHGHPLKKQTIEQMSHRLLQGPSDQKLYICAPVVQGKRGQHEAVFDKLQAQGFTRVFCDGHLYELDERPELDPKVLHSIDVMIDRLILKGDQKVRLTESLETAVRVGQGLVSIFWLDENDKVSAQEIISSQHACPSCGFSVSNLEPRLFSFNNPHGSCPECDGLGFEEAVDPARMIQPNLSLSQGALWGFQPMNGFYFELLEAFCDQHNIAMNVSFTELSVEHQKWLLKGHPTKKTVQLKESSKIKISKVKWEGALAILQRRFETTTQTSLKEEVSRLIRFMPCDVCHGERLNKEARFVKITDKNLPSFCQLSIDEAITWLMQLDLQGQEKQIAQQILNEIQTRLTFLKQVGLGYLTLSRQADTLSGGESQRIRLASQIGSKLVGVMYILDEPSIGLHQRDNQLLISTLRSLVDLGNTVIVVEHDEEAMLAADHLIDVGPGAGSYGGQIIAQGDPMDVQNHPNSLTGAYLSGKKKITPPSAVRSCGEKFLEVKGAYENNLKNVSIKIPIGLFTCITGVSGSGKSSLMNRTLAPYLSHKLNHAHLGAPIKASAIEGIEHLDKIVIIDQSPIGRTPRSNPATYTGVLAPIRDLFAQTEQAKILGFAPGRFSFNVQGGRCEHCEGDGVIKVEMHFLADVYITCEQCQGSRYNQQTLSVHYKGKTISDVLKMTVDEATEFFKNIPSIYNKLFTLQKVGLGYIQLGQNAVTLSGGEAQRIKLSKELAKRDTGKTLYLLDEPTTGLHFADIQQLLQVLFELRDKGNTMCIIEHNLDVIKCADWLIDLGPEGGAGGGELLAQGPIEVIAACNRSHTGRFLK